MQPAWRTVWRFLKKLKIEQQQNNLKIKKIELPHDPTILLLGIYSKERRSGY